jgi:hypothetical protein
MAPSLVAVVVASVLLGGAAIQPQRSDFDRADANTVRLPPSAFPDLPAPVRADLARRGCTVPQTFLRRGAPQNVIRGRFLSPEPTDVAVLCSRSRRSVILVYRGGVVPAIAELAGLPDAMFLQVVDATGGIGFSRLLTAAAPGHIRGHAARVSGPHPAVDHDGIEDYFLEKSSSILYWSGRKWLELPGAD